MKRFFAALFFLCVTPVAFAVPNSSDGGSPPEVNPPPANPDPLFFSPAFKAICASAVTAHPTKPGFWIFDFPSFASSGDSLFATLDLRPTPAGEYAVVKVDRANPAAYRELMRFPDPIRALELHDQKLWLLFSQRIVALDPASGSKVLEVPTMRAALSESSAAVSFAWVGERLVIAHGDLGMMVFDPLTRQVSAPTDLGLSASGIQFSKFDSVAALGDSQAIFAVEDEAPNMFDGLIVADLKTGATQRYPYKEKASGSLSRARIKVDGDEVIINNWGIFQRASLSAMKRTGDIQVSWTPLRLDLGGQMAHGELLGDPVIDQGVVGACAHAYYQDPSTGKMVHLGVPYLGGL